jgi:hypothetical protein
VDPSHDAGEEPPAELKLTVRRLAPAGAGLTVLDADADGGADLLVWSAKGAELYLKGESRVDMPALDSLRDVTSAAAADFDNDGLTDLCVTAASGAVLLKNTKGRFEKHGATSLPAGRFEKAVWLDYDHDNDLDLFLLGAKSVLMRNQGSAGFADRTTDFPFVEGEAISAAVFRLVPDTKMQDMVVTYAKGNGVLYRDKLAGVYEAVPLKEIPAGASGLTAADVDNNGWIDVAFTTGQRVVTLLSQDGKWRAVEVSVSGAPTFADLENRGRLDLIAGGQVFRNGGGGRFDSGKQVPGLPNSAAWTSADFNGDGRTDLAGAAADGTVVARNETAVRNNWMRVALNGVKAPKLAPGAEVEVKAGTRYQKKTYDGLPLLFGLRADASIDTIRITWPNGLIQNETKQAVNQNHSYKEEERLTGSCPMIWTWNGREFQFITDVLGVAPLGASSGDGNYFPTDHDEYVQIPADALALRDGKYEVRITEELSEVAYLDQVKLVAVDHPSDVTIFTNEKFQGPPFPPFHLFGVRERAYPVAARDHEGRDVLARLTARDRRYPDAFRRSYSGVAELHALELDFERDAAPQNNAVLVLNGWVDWADGSTFRARAQEQDGGLVMPYLQVKDAGGQWRTVIDDMGIPAGKPKTIVVDLAGKFLAHTRAVRIVTNLCVYWDEIFLAENAASPRVQLTSWSPESANLGFRGFSKVEVHPARKQPEMFFYPQPRPVSNWNPTRGFYTRYGAVEELLEKIDDRFVIMGSGDEVRLLFDAVLLPALEAGWRRDFLLFVDGWAKDSDPNTAYSQNVEPLPFHGMSRYPYPATERYPDSESHRKYREEYNTRPALRLLRGLAGDVPDEKRGVLSRGGRSGPAAD